MRLNDVVIKQKRTSEKGLVHLLGQKRSRSFQVAQVFQAIFLLQLVFAVLKWSRTQISNCEPGKERQLPLQHIKILGELELASYMKKAMLHSTEADEPLIGDEKQWHSPELETDTLSKTKNLTTAFKSYRWLIDAFLLLVILALFLVLQDQWKKPSITQQVGGDLITAGGTSSLDTRCACQVLSQTLPVLPTKTAKFESDTSFVPKNTSEFFSDETLARWKTLMPGTSRISPKTFLQRE